MYLYIIYAYIVLLRCNLRQENMYIYSPILTSDFWKYPRYVPDISPSPINFPGWCSRCGRHLEHCIYLILPSLRVMSRVPTALHLPVAYIDDITMPIAIYNDTYKFITYPYSFLQKFAVDSKVMITNHPETVRKLHVWRTYFDRILKRSASIFSRDDASRSTICALIELPSSTIMVHSRGLGRRLGGHWDGSVSVTRIGIGRYAQNAT